MANKYSKAKAILLNNGTEQLLPVSKAKLIELANDQKGKFGKDVVDVAGALSYLLSQDATNLEAAKTYTGTSIEALDSTITADTGYVLTGITEADGKLTSYTQTWLDASVITYQSANENINTVKDVIENIQKDLSAAVGDGGSVSQQINTALDALDLPQVSETGKAIVAVSQENGKVAATAGSIKAEYVNVDNTGDKFKIDGDKPTTLTTQATLEHLQGEIKAVESAAAKYSIEKVTEGLDTNVAHRYKLTQTINDKSEQAGAVIDIPKDKSLVAVQLGHIDDTLSGEDSTTHESASSTIVSGTGADALVFVHQLANGNYKLTTVDVSSFLRESEFGNGLQVDNGVVSVKVTDADNFLSVDATDGVKLSGVQSAINTAKGEATVYADGLIKGLDSEIEAKTEDGFSYVMTGVTEADGKLTAATYIGLTDENVKTTFTSEDAVKVLAGNNDVTDVKKALNLIAGNISSLTSGTLGDITITDGKYVKASNASKNSTTYVFSIDDSALGNVATLNYDDLGTAEVASIFN